MEIKQKHRTKLSAKRTLIAFTAFSLLLAFGIIIIVNLSDKREARASVNGDYRTKTSGNWNDTLIWERYNGSAWIAATTTRSLTDGTIEMLSGHYITVTSNVTVDQFIIDAGGMLINSSRIFTVANGPGTDFAIN